MCGGSTFCAPVPRPSFVHVVRPVAAEMPDLIPYSGEEIECAFPDLFEFLTAIMFLNPTGYPGTLDDEQRSPPGSWYALSWGCIHRDVLPVWSSYSRSVRWSFWKGCWNWIATFGKQPIVEPGYGKETALAFFDPLPIKLFERAVFRLTRAGMLDRMIEEHGPTSQTISVYHPTPALAERLRKARMTCST